jgi:D-lyxose ketol-isomerase
MKRSEINAILSDGKQFIQGMRFYLPPFAYWTLDKWPQQPQAAREIFENSLGWDVTDFGSGSFHRTGLLLFTLRNGSAKEMLAKRGKLYCEKIMVTRVGQLTPMHFHRTKVEDIINRGGGKFTVKLCNSTEDAELATSDVKITVDGIKHTVKAGSELTLAPGESVTIRPGLYHSFWGEGETVLVGEISLVNDDISDNIFLTSVGRFPQIEDDEQPLHLLVSDYSRYSEIDGK